MHTCNRYHVVFALLCIRCLHSLEQTLLTFLLLTICLMVQCRIQMCIERCALSATGIASACCKYDLSTKTLFASILCGAHDRPRIATNLQQQAELPLGDQEVVMVL